MGNDFLGNRLNFHKLYSDRLYIWKNPSATISRNVGQTITNIILS